jgi:hypothetical protein
MTSERHVRVKFMRPLKWDGELRQPGYECAMPIDTMRSLLRHGAVRFMDDAPAKQSIVGPVASPRTTTPGKKSATTKTKGRKG